MFFKSPVIFLLEIVVKKASTGSKLIGKRIRSPELNDNNLLSSRDEFNASIHIGSTEPSRTINGQIYGFSLLLINYTADLAAFVSAPSFHSFVTGSTKPNKSYLDIDLGAITNSLICIKPYVAFSTACFNN